jgi:hypothetical protein
VSGKSRQVKKATRVVQLYVGGDWDLVDEYNRLDAERQNPKTMAGTDRTRLDELAVAIAEDTMSFRFEALGRRSLQKLLDEHPPREGKVNVFGQPENFNEDTATAELIRRCLKDPDLPPKDLDELLDEELSDGQYERLSDAVWSINRRSIDVPLSLTASTNRRSTGDA